MKVTEVFTHMSVQFGVRKRELRHFTTDSSAKTKNIKLEIVDGIGIRASNEEDSVVIPFINITCFKTEPEKKKTPALTKSEREVLGMEPDSTSSSRGSKK
jgi:hypothetical protein